MATKKETTYTGVLGSWRELLPPLAAHAGDLPHLEGLRAKLVGLLNRADEIIHRQGLLAADRQELTEELRSVLTSGQRTAAHLRSGVKEHYGPRSQRLSEFGLQPFRGRKTKPAPEVEEEPGETKSPNPAA